MVEYDCTKNVIKQVVKYPDKFYPATACKYKDDTIAMVTGGSIVFFNVSTNNFSEPVSIPNLGWCSAIAIREYIHLFHGNNNKKREYLVYSVSEGTCTTFPDETHSWGVYQVAVVKGPENKFYKFGGVRSDHCATSSFLVGSLQNGNAAEPIQWEPKSNSLRLPKSLFSFGYVQHGPFIVILGGKEKSRVSYHVSILDLRGDPVWRTSTVAVPWETTYAATIDDDENIHLFSHGHYIKKETSHLAIAFKSIIAGLDVVANKKGKDKDGTFVSI